MSKRVVSGLALTMLLIGMLTWLFNLGMMIPQVDAQSTTILAVDPLTYTAPYVGHIFSLNITIANVTDLYGYEVRVWYNTTILDGLSVYLPTGHFLTPSDPANIFVAAKEVNDAYNATHGRIWVAVALLAPEPAKSGSGVLFTIMFKVTSQEGGLSPIEIWTPGFPYPSKLVSNIPPYKEPPGIPHSALDGEVTVLAPIIHDVATVSIVTSTNETYVGRLVFVNVTAMNKGDFTETFDVTCKYELEGIEHIIGVMTVNNLAPRANTTIVFTWTTTDVTVHTISANATILPDETDTSDNAMTSPTTVKVKILGDVNNDDTVNILDLVVVANSLGAVPWSWAWNPQADIYPDGHINIFDLVMIVLRFGKTA